MIIDNVQNEEDVNDNNQYYWNPAKSQREITYNKKLNTSSLWIHEKIIINNIFVWINIINVYIAVNQFLGINKKNSFKKSWYFFPFWLDPEQQLVPCYHETDPRIRSRIKMKRIRNTFNNDRIN